MLLTLVTALLPTSLPARLLPGGGQVRARRNAWAGRAEGVQRARARAEADAAVRLAEERWAAGEARAVR